MEANIYPVVAFELKRKVRDFIDQLSNERQIDTDANGYPFVLSIRRMDNTDNYDIAIRRNGRKETILLNSRRKNEKPRLSWNPADGFMRKDVLQGDSSQGERGKRNPYMEMLDSVVK